MSLLLVLACTNPPASPADTSPTDTSPETSTDTGVVAATITALTAVPAEEIPAVVIASWHTDAEAPGTITFGTGKTTLAEITATDEGGGSWSAVLVGLPPLTDGWLTVRHGEVTAETTVTTGEGPDLAEAHTLTGSGSGYVLTSMLRDDGASMIPVIFNADGQPVWWHQWSVLREGYTSRVWLVDGRILYNIYRISTEEEVDFSGLVSVSFDGSDVQSTPLDNHHHDFWLHDDGTLAWLEYDWREEDGARIAGDVLMIQEPDGTRYPLWSSLDALTLSPTKESFKTLANQLEYSAADNAYYIGLREVNAIVRVNAGTGATDWVLGGELDGFALEDPFRHQHGIERTEDGLIVFDNDGGDQSRVQTFSLDGGVATATHTHTADPPRDTPYFGGIDLLEDGMVITWGREGIIERLDSSGAITQTIEFGAADLGFVHWEAELY